MVETPTTLDGTMRCHGNLFIPSTNFVKWPRKMEQQHRDGSSRITKSSSTSSGVDSGGHNHSYGHLWDRCLSRAIVNIGIGFGFGVLSSVILFRRKTWPFATGAGFGAGMSFAQCQFDFTHPDIIYGRILPVDRLSEIRTAQIKRKD